MRYFAVVPFWKLALLNLIVGSFLSVGFSIAFIIMNPLICLDRSCSKITTVEYIIAILIYVVIIFVGCFSNVIMWKKYKKSNLALSNKTVSMASVLKLIGSIVIFAIGLFTLYFLFSILSFLIFIPVRIQYGS